MKQYDIALLGGDIRNSYMIPYFLQKGYKVICYGTQTIPLKEMEALAYAETWQEAVEKSDCIIGGIPFFKNGTVFFKENLPDLKQDDLQSCLEKGQTIFGGVIPKDFIAFCNKKEVNCYDFMADETLAIFNAVATAEGTILEALTHQATNIHGSQSLILGYGRCGKILAEKLKGMNADVTICSQCETELAYAEAFGLHPLPLYYLKEKIHKYEYIYNTIPSVILKKAILAQINHDALIIDIASGLGGVDYASAEKLGIRAYHCLGLPGKYAPKISAKKLVDFVVHKIE